MAANISEAWRKRRYEAAFVSKLSDAEAEVAETQTWVEMALRCGYLSSAEAAQIDDAYEVLISQLVTMLKNASNWTIPPASQKAAQGAEGERA